jgi:WD40 repeat protein
MLDLSSDGGTLVTVDEGGTVALWDMETRQRRATLPRSKATIEVVEISPDGRTLATSSSGGTLSLWDLDGGLSWATLQGHASESLAFAPDGRTLATVGGVTVRLWDVATGRSKGVLFSLEKPDLAWRWWCLFGLAVAAWFVTCWKVRSASRKRKAALAASVGRV